MIIKPSKTFEGSDPSPEIWMEYVSSRDWTVQPTRKTVIAVFFRAANLGLEKKVAVKRLEAWLLRHTEILPGYMTLMGYANFAYRETRKKAEEQAKGVCE